MVDVSDDRRLISVGPEGAIQNLSADFSVRDPELQAVPLWLERGARIEQLSWALDWQGEAPDVGKPPIVDHGGIIRQLHWVHTPPKYVKAELDKTDPHALTVRFSEPVRSTDFADGVTIRVNGMTVPILETSHEANSDSVRYRILPEMHFDDVVTWAYDAANGTIQNLDGDNMLSVGAKDFGTRR